jgi:hypothetical protein
VSKTSVAKGNEITPVKLVGYGVDTLYLSVRYAHPEDYEKKSPATLDGELMAQLEDLKAMAKEQEKEIATPWMFRDKPLLIAPYGVGNGQFSWLLKSPYANISVSRGSFNGIIAQVRLTSQYLWSHVWCGDALTEMHTFLRELFGEHIYIQVSSVDLCADVAGWNPNMIDWQERFISRAVGDSIVPFSVEGITDGPDKVDRRWKKINGLSFGQHASRLSVVIYNKRLEIEQKSRKVWFYPLWESRGWDGEMDVWRIEARFRREFLRGAGIDWAYDFLNRIQDLWAYAVGHVEGGEDGFPDGWLRLVVPSATDTTRTRWAVDPVWQVVQSAFHDVEEHHLSELVFKQEKEQYIQRCIQQIGGCVTSLAAQGSDLYPVLGSNLYETMEWLTHALEAYYKFKDVSFSRIVGEKRMKLASLKS